MGYAASVAIVLAAATVLGATAAQAASWRLAVSLGKAFGSTLLSWWSKVLVVLAWSTPGAALIAATGGIRPLGATVARFPDGTAAGMLAGVPLAFCLKGLGAAHGLPMVVLPMVAVFPAMRLVNPALAVNFGTDPGGLSLSAPDPEPVVPAFRLSLFLGFGVPLYLLPLASQNLPGCVTLRAVGYQPPAARALTVTGVDFGGDRLFWRAHDLHGGHYSGDLFWSLCPPRPRPSLGGVAGLCRCPGGPRPTQPDRTAACRRLGCPAVVLALVALALLFPLLGAVTGAFAVTEQRFAATLTLVVTASGVAAFGIGAAFWGLIEKLQVQAPKRLRRQAVAQNSSSKNFGPRDFGLQAVSERHVIHRVDHLIRRDHPTRDHLFRPRMVKLDIELVAFDGHDLAIAELLVEYPVA